MCAGGLGSSGAFTAVVQASASAVNAATPLASIAEECEPSGVTGIPDGPTFDSIEALAQEADLAITGHVTASLGSVIDDGGDEGGGGHPLCLFEVSVNDVLVGDLDHGRITVAMLNLGAGAGMPAVEFAEGDELVLYPERETSATAPGVDVEGDFYTPLSGGNGVLRLDGDRAVPTGPLPNRLREDGPPPEPPQVSDNGEEDLPDDGAPMLVDDVMEVSISAGQTERTAR